MENETERMTYRELRDYLNNMDERNLDCDVTLCNEGGEFFPAIILESEGDVVLDDGHPYFVCTDWQGSIQ